MHRSPGSVIAACFALSAFLVAILAGLAAANPALTVLARALIAMVLCYPAGLVVGLICELVVSTPRKAETTETPGTTAEPETQAQTEIKPLASPEAAEAVSEESEMLAV